MGRTVRQLQREMDAAEFMEHWIDSQLEPWGDERADLHAGIIASALANTWRGKETSPYSPEAFMPLFYQQEPDALADEDAMTTEYMGMYEGMTVAMGGVVVEGQAEWP